MAGLNDMQEQACEHVDGPLLILAGAGSGKTRVITHRVAYLMEHEGVNPLNILAITFTNKAAREMRERVDLIVGDGADRVWVSTFHSLCVRILRRYADKIGYGKNFDIYDSDDQKSTVKSILKDFQIDPKRYPEKMFMAEISKAKEKYLSPDEFAKKNAADYAGTKAAEVYRVVLRRTMRWTLTILFTRRWSCSSTILMSLIHIRIDSDISWLTSIRILITYSSCWSRCLRENTGTCVWWETMISPYTSSEERI